MDTFVNERKNSEFIPYKYRKPEDPTTNIETLIHLLKGSLGTGILAMPLAFFHSGLIIGIVGMVFIGILCTYCTQILIKTQYELCRRKYKPFLTYREAFKAALEEGPPCLKFIIPAAPIIIDFFLVFYQIGICSVYIIFVSENFKAIFDFHFPDYTLNLRLYMTILLLPLFILVCIKNLKALVPLMSLANVFIIIGLAIIFSYIFQDVPPLSERDMVGELKGFPLFFGTALFSIEAIGTILVIERNMKTPENFPKPCGVFNIAMLIIVFMYTFMGLFGCIKYGAELHGTISLNIPEEEVLAQVSIILYSLAIFFSYSLQLYVPFVIIWGNYVSYHAKMSTYGLYYRYGLRFLLVIISYLLALSIPKLGLFISLFGAFCLSSTGIIFPLIMHICLLYPDGYGKCNWIFIKDLLLILVGVMGMLLGTIVSIEEIIVWFNDNE